MNRWRIGGLIALVLVIIVGTYGATTLFGGSDPPGSPEEQPLVNTQGQVAAREVAVSGRLVFPRKAELTFDATGEVGEILVAAGDRVTEGQTLARLDPTTTAALERAVAKARLDLDVAEDALDEAREDFVDTPLERARFEESIARARVALEDAEESLEDFHRDQEQALAAAQKAKAEAEVLVDQTKDNLKDFERDYQKTLAAAQTAKADAEVVLDDAQKALRDFNRDESQELAQARNQEAAADLALDQAQDALLDFIIDYDQELADARKRVADAEVGLEAAEDNLTDFKAAPSFDRRQDQSLDTDTLRRLEVAVTAAQAELKQARKDLSRIDGGPDSLKRQELEAAVAVARANLVKARDDVAELDEGVDQLKLRQRQAAVSAAEATLAQATEDLTEELEGPDPLRQQALEAALQLARAQLTQAETDLTEELAGPDARDLAVREKAVAKRQEELNELIDGPDPFQVGLKEADVAAARAALEDALDDLAGASIVAPFGGVVLLVNVEVDDLVDDESRIMEVVDARQVALDGQIDAGDRNLVAVVYQARVELASLSGRKLSGTVLSVDQEPSTRRGVVSYGVIIGVELPPGVEAPVELSQISGVIMPQ